MTVTAFEALPGNDVVVSKGPCPKCGSKDNMVTYGDGHEKCFSPGCTHYLKPILAQGGGTPTKLLRKTFGGDADSGPILLDPTKQQDPWGGLQARGLTADTCRRFGVFRAGFNGKKVVAYPYYDRHGQAVAQKLRLPDKEFVTVKGAPEVPGLADCQLFGRHVFGDRYDRKVVVVEGEYDAMSVAQAADFSYACVSVNTGAGSAVKCLKANYLWLDRFAEIVLWFDADVPGREAMEECAKLFKVGKVRLATAMGDKKDGSGPCKDASDILQAGRPGDIKSCVFAAQAWRPKGIVNASANASDVLAPKDDEGIAWPYPEQFPKLQSMTGGLRLGEVVYHVAGTGVGKSTMLREIEADCIGRHKLKLGVMSFEDTRRDSKLGIMSIFANARLHLAPLPDAEMLALHDKVFASGLVELFDPETAEWQVEAIMGYIRYLAMALDCKVVVIDPLTFLAAGLDLSADERRVLDKAARDLAALCKELNINLQVSHHLTRTAGLPHEEGAQTSLNQVRGSGGIANFAMTVIGHERNGQAEDPLWRLARFRVLKCRHTGQTGLADTVSYNDNGRLEATHLDFPAPASREGDHQRHSGGGKPFSPAMATGDY